MKKFLKPYNLVIAMLLVLNLLPILAPIFLHLGLDFLAKPIYFIYSFTCHQFAHRSLHIYDHQCAWCSRDMAIWGSLLLVAILVRQLHLREGLKWYWLLPTTIPIALDGGIQTIATLLGLSPGGTTLYISTNFMRFLSGSIFGAGLGLWMLPGLYDSFNQKVTTVTGVFKAKHFFGIIATMMVIYVGFIGIWRVTSNEVLPANILDLQVKTPVNKDFFIRRETGICPSDALGNDPLAWECFFGK